MLGRRHERLPRRKTVTKLPFEWHHPGEVKKADEVALETTTIETIVALMASALIAVVRGAKQTEEVGDER
jgi:hypothetical protein